MIDIDKKRFHGRMVYMKNQTIRENSMKILTLILFTLLFTFVATAQNVEVKGFIAVDYNCQISNLEMYRYDWKWNKLKPSNFQLMNFQCGRIHEDIMVFSKAKAVYVSNGNIMNYYPQKEKLDKPRNVKKTMYGTKNSTLREGHTIKELGERTYEYKLPKSIIEFSNANIKEKKHPTEKPVILCEYLIKTYTNEDDLVLDNCAGSGTTLLAAKNLNRQFIGIEKEEKYVDIIKDRLK